MSVGIVTHQGQHVFSDTFVAAGSELQAGLASDLLELGRRSALEAGVLAT